jgi:hypothetical protein
VWLHVFAFIYGVLAKMISSPCIEDINIHGLLGYTQIHLNPYGLEGIEVELKLLNHVD